MATTTKQNNQYCTTSPSIDANTGPWTSIEAYLAWLSSELGVDTPQEGTEILVKDNTGAMTKYRYEIISGTPTWTTSASEVAVDSALDATSDNPVKNKVIAGALADKANIADVYSKQQVDNLISQSAVTVDTALSPSSTNPVQNKKVAEALDGKVGGVDYSDGDLVLYSDPEKTNEIDRVNLNVDRILSFEIDDTTGCLMMTEENMGSSMDFEIDENGNLNLILE